MDKMGVLKSVIYLTKFVLKNFLLLYNPNKPGQSLVNSSMVSHLKETNKQQTVLQM